MKYINSYIPKKVSEDESFEYELTVMRERLESAIEDADWNLLDPEVIRLSNKLDELINQYILSKL